MILPPSDMAAELSAWNEGKGIDLESWIGCTGSFRLAVGYSAVFWPRFVLFDEYILRDGFNLNSLREFEQSSPDKRAVEKMMNHQHIADIHHYGCDDISVDRIVYLGRVLKEIHEAKLRWQFPDRPCKVEFLEPGDRSDLTAFEMSFWQEGRD